MADILKARYRKDDGLQGIASQVAMSATSPPLCDYQKEAIAKARKVGRWQRRKKLEERRPTRVSFVCVCERARAASRDSARAWN
jgi:hypothetical protein